MGVKNNNIPFLSPKEYLQLLFKIFFKVISFQKEVEEWTVEKRLHISLQVIAYNFLLLIISSLFILCLVFFLNGKISILSVKIAFRITIGITLGTALGIALEKTSGLMGGVLGVFIGFIYGLLYNNIEGITFSLAYGIAYSIAYGINYYNNSGIFEGIILAISTSLALIIAFSNTVKVSDTILYGITIWFVYFLTLSRLFYYPFYLFIPLDHPKNPLQWDENIALPILGLPTLLRNQSRQSLQKTTDFAHFLIRNRRIHQAQAQKGLSLIACDQMANFQSIAQIQKLSKHLSFLPDSDSLTETHNQYMQSMNQIAKDAQLVEKAYNPADQIRLLQQIETDLKNFQKQLDFSRNWEANAFQGVVAQWLTIINNNIQERSKEGLPLPNPFITGKPINQKDQELFVGRQDIIQEIQKEALKKGTKGAILFLGSRRSGKSSTLLNMQPLLHSSLHTRFIDFQSSKFHTSTAIFVKSLAAVISTIKILPKPTSTLQNFNDLEHFLEDCQTILAEENQYLLLCFDEYERLEKYTKTGKLSGLLDSLRHWIQYLDNILFLFAGSHDPKDLKGIDWSDYLINARTVYISYLEEKAALQLVTRPIASYDIEYANADLPQQIIQRLGCQPYLIQCFMYELTEILNHDNSRRLAHADDIDAAVVKLFDTAQMHFEHFWETEMAALKAQELLLAIAQNTYIYQVKDRPILKQLLKREIIKETAKKEYQIWIPVVQEWMIEQF